MSARTDGTSPAELRELAEHYEGSAKVCDDKGWSLLAARDRRIAATMRQCADMLAADKALQGAEWPVVQGEGNAGPQ